VGDDKIERLILMPRRGFRARDSLLSIAAAPLLEALHDRLSAHASLLHAGGILPVACRIIDSIRGDGPKLIELARGDIPALRAAFPILDLVPVVYYRPAAAPRPTASTPAAAAAAGAAGSGVSIRIVDAVSHQGVAGAEVSAFTNFAGRDGETVFSAADGTAQFDWLGAAPAALERLYVYPPLAGYWGYYKPNVSLTNGLTITLQRIDMTKPDSLRHFYGNSSPTAGAGVKVGIIDGGVGPHNDVVCKGDPDNGRGHGTHVAGIIAGRGSAPTGMRGLAPGVELRSYRVFEADESLSSNFTLSKAIDTAVRDDKCDLINMSTYLQGVTDDPAVRGALEDARAAGTLPIAAAGNAFRQPVAYPARDAMCIAVSALGREGLFPPESVEAADVVAPFGNDPKNYIAAFSNSGVEIDVVAPGTGVVSTVPGGYGVMSGTSMACPAVTGIAARLLAGNAEVLQMSRGPERSARIAQLVMGAAASLGFAAELQGAGLPSLPGEV